MIPYRTELVTRLAKQLRLSPQRHRARQIEGIRRALGLIEPGRDFPGSFIVFHVTGYRGKQAVDVEYCGQDLIADLVLLLDQVTLANPIDAAEAAGACEAAVLCGRWNISSKTLERWRPFGLPAAWYRGADGPMLLFRAEDVAAFERANARRIERARRYRRLYDPERQSLARRALALVGEKGMTLTEATCRVAEETGRAPETVRLAVRRLERESRAADPRAQDDPIACDEARMHAAHQRGVSIADLAGQFGRAESDVRTVVLRRHAAELAGRPIKYIYAAEYDHPDADRLVFTDSPDPDPAPVAHEPTAEMPAYLRELYRVPLLTAAQERDLFRRMNFLLHRAEQARRLLDVDHPTAAAIDHVETQLGRALQVKNRIVQSNLRLVVSIAKRHLATGGMDLFDLVSEGNLVLIRAVEGFDVARGNRFSTYATWAVVRHFARLLGGPAGRGDRLRTGCETAWLEADGGESHDFAAEMAAAESERVLTEALYELGAREREIVSRRFGFDPYEAQTLAEVSEALSLSRERVRQIERDSLAKLRVALSRRGMAAVA